MENLIISFYDSEQVSNKQSAVMDEKELHKLLSQQEHSTVQTSNPVVSIRKTVTSDTLSSVLSQLGSTIKHQYTIIPAVAAHVPTKVANRLRYLQNEGLGVQSVEVDQQVHIAASN